MGVPSQKIDVASKRQGRRRDARIILTSGLRNSDASHPVSLYQKSVSGQSAIFGLNHLSKRGHVPSRGLRSMRKVFLVNVRQFL
jgi:hypothetical protein